MAKANPFRFSTKYQDDETDLVMYPARPYSPSTGRFNCRDLLGELGGLNLNAFVSNNPEDYFDDFGQQAKSASPQQPPTNKPATNPTEPPPVPPDPNNPPSDADRQTREQFAQNIMNQFQAWRNRNKCCNLDLCTLISQWMYESNWGRSRAAGGKNLGGITEKGPVGSTGNFRK
jgi:RHS repeat-associated protein